MGCFTLLCTWKYVYHIVRKVYNFFTLDSAKTSLTAWFISEVGIMFGVEWVPRLVQGVLGCVAPRVVPDGIGCAAPCSEYDGIACAWIALGWICVVLWFEEQGGCPTSGFTSEVTACWLGGTCPTSELLGTEDNGGWACICNIITIWNHHKCLSQLFLLHLNTYVMGLRPLEIFLILQCGDRL